MSGFKDVVGHSEIIQYIQNAVTEDKVSHAYIQNRAMSAIRASRQSAAIIRILSG